VIHAANRSMHRNIRNIASDWQKTGANQAEVMEMVFAYFSESSSRSHNSSGTGENRNDWPKS
jgi:hypothetical protein